VWKQEEGCHRNLELQAKVVAYMTEHPEPMTVDRLSEAVGQVPATESVFKILRRLAGTGKIMVSAGASVFADQYELTK
jgi:hypothetical protein